MPYIQYMQTVVETESYLRAAKDVGMSAEEMTAAVDLVAGNPEAGDVMQGTGGVRKARLAGVVKAAGKALVAQYDAYEALPGEHVKGEFTLGENIGDLAGLTIAYDAYQHSLGGKKPPVIDGFTADQRFYLGWAQIWRRNYREANLRQRLLTDPHTCVVTAVPDESRGERLVVFFTDPLMTAPALWERLCQADMPRLWLPKREDMHHIEAIPTLGTGKTDLRRVKQLAVERTSSSGQAFI